MVANAMRSVMRSQAVRGILDSLQDELMYAAVGPSIGGISGAMASKSSVASTFGAAVGVGAMRPDDPMIKAMYEMEQQFGAGAQARGAAQIRGALGSESAEEIARVIGEGLKHAITEFLPEVVEAFKEMLTP
jgi:hypothetical protein